MEQWYSDKASRDDADDVIVKAGETISGIDVVLEHVEPLETIPPTTTLAAPTTSGTTRPCI